MKKEHPNFRSSNKKDNLRTNNNNAQQPTTPSRSTQTKEGGSGFATTESGQQNALKNKNGKPKNNKGTK